jgi:hypothetical protein
MKEITIKTAETTFLALKKTANELAQKCASIVISDESSKQIAIQNYSMLKEKIWQIEEIRVKEKAPYLDAGKQIDALAKALKDPMDVVLQEGRNKIKEYDTFQAQIAKIEADRLQVIKDEITAHAKNSITLFDQCDTIELLSKARDRVVVNFIPPIAWQEVDELYQLTKISLNDYCKQRRIEIMSPKQADESVAQMIKEEIAETIEKATPVAYQSTTKMRGTPKFNVLDLGAVPREWLMVDEAKVKEYQKANKGITGIVNGIEFFVDYSVTIK